MSRKKTINLAVPKPLLDEFREVCKHYGHAKQKGLVLSAAILMFLEADPAEQGQAMERILIADVRSGVEALVERAKQEQVQRIEGRQQDAAASVSAEGRSVDGSPLPFASPPPAKAAKRARPAVKPLTNLPRSKDGRQEGEGK